MEDTEGSEDLWRGSVDFLSDRTSENAASDQCEAGWGPSATSSSWDSSRASEVLEASIEVSTDLGKMSRAGKLEGCRRRGLGDIGDGGDEFNDDKETTDINELTGHESRLAASDAWSGTRTKLGDRIGDIGDDENESSDGEHVVGSGEVADRTSGFGVCENKSTDCTGLGDCDRWLGAVDGKPSTPGDVLRGDGLFG